MLKSCRHFLNVFKYGSRKNKPFSVVTYKAFSENRKENEGPKDEFNFDKDEKEEFNKDAGKKVFYVFTASAIVVSVIYFGISASQPETKVESIRRSGGVTYVGKAKIGGEWSLKDCDGKEYGSKQLSGKYYLIYFGFTRCPDVCPISLQKIAKVIKDLKLSPESKYYDIEAIFVSLDPDRDSPERVKKYLSLFDKSFIGVNPESNNDPKLKQMLKDFKIHASKIELNEKDEQLNNETFKRNASFVYDSIMTEPKEDVAHPNTDKYAIDHTIVTYLMSPTNTFVTYLSGNLSSSEMKDLILDNIFSNEDIKVKKF